MNIMPFLMDFTETLSDMMDYDNEYEDDFGFLVYPHEIHRRVHRPARFQMYSARRLPYNVGGVKNLPTTTLTPTVGKSKNEDGEKNAVTSSLYYSTIGKNGFQVCMNVQQFKPNELTVKTVDNIVIVEGKHDEREDDNGLIARQFTRKYNLPKGFDPKEVISTLSSDGILTIKSPLPVKSYDSAERIVQIQHTGPAHLSVKENPKVNIPIVSPTTNNLIVNNPTTNNLIVNSNKNPNMNSTPIINNNSNSTPTTTPSSTTTTNNNNNNNNPNPVAPNNTNPDIPTTIQKEKSENVVIKEKCENGEKSENDKIIEQNKEAIED